MSFLRLTCKTDVVTYSIRGYHWNAYTCLPFHVRRRCWGMSFFSRWPCGQNEKHTNASGLQAYFLSQRLDGQECCSGLSTMSWPSADPCLSSAFCLCLLPWVRCSAWPRCGRWPLDLSHTSAAVPRALSPRAVGEEGNEEDAFPKNSFSSRVMARGRGLKEEVRGLQELPCRSHRDASPSPRLSRGYYNSSHLDLSAEENWMIQSFSRKREDCLHHSLLQ